MHANIKQKLIAELAKLKGAKAKTNEFIDFIKQNPHPLPNNIAGKMKATFLFSAHIAKNPLLLNEENRKTIDHFPKAMDLPEIPEERPTIGNHRKK